jgi:hypothetical protein
MWCRAMYPHSSFPELVTPEKLLAFLEAQKGRPSKKNPEETIGLPTYYQYVTSVKDLYTTQVITKETRKCTQNSRG